MSEERFDLVIRGRRILTTAGIAAREVGVRGGKIVAIEPLGNGLAGAEVIELADDETLLPGLVDTHVHVNEPGRTEWEGWASATAAAAAGGVTTIVEMPLNGIPPTTGEPGVRARREALAGVARVDVALWGGLVSADPEPLATLAALGVAGLKCFLCPSGVPEFPHIGETELDATLPVLRSLGLPLLAHAESPAALARAAVAAGADADPREHATWLASRPAAAEEEAIDLLVRLARKHRARVHVVHVSSRGGAERIARARAEGIPVSGETCPHYLAFTAAEVPAGATAYKCAPPIREGAHRDALWAALGEGTLEMVASDHSPCPPAMKALEEGDFLRAWGGIASLELLLPAVWTGAAARGIGAANVMRWLSESPAALAGLTARKGRIAPGCDADFVLWDDQATFTVDPRWLHHRHPVTPWAGRRLRGVVRQAWLRGRLVYDRDRGFPGTPGGTFLPVRREPEPAAAN